MLSIEPASWVRNLPNLLSFGDFIYLTPVHEPRQFSFALLSLALLACLPGVVRERMGKVEFERTKTWKARVEGGSFLKKLSKGISKQRTTFAFLCSGFAQFLWQIDSVSPAIDAFRSDVIKWLHKWSHKFPFL